MRGGKVLRAIGKVLQFLFVPQWCLRERETEGHLLL